MDQRYLRMGQRVAALRKCDKLDQTDFGKLVFISRSEVSRIELGQKLPNVHILVRIAKLFKVSTDYLLALDDGSIDHGLPAITDEELAEWAAWKVRRQVIEAVRTPDGRLNRGITNQRNREREEDARRAESDN